MENGHGTYGKPLRIGDIAQRAGVSIGTVSRALNNRPDVAPETRERVLAIVQQTGFVRNPSARHLVGSRTGVIEVVVSETLDDYVGQIIRGISSGLRTTEFGLLLRLHAYDAVYERQYIARLSQRTADGVILVTPKHVDAELSRLAAQAFPTVVIAHRSGDPVVPSISIREHAAARQAVDYLIGLGHRRIAIITGNLGEHSARERLRGYRDALAAASLPCSDEYIALGDYSADGGADAMRTLLKSTPLPSAVFACSDLMALSALHVIHEAGYVVPQDLSVMGFDNFSFSASSTPPLTTIQQPLVEMGRIATEMLLDSMDGKSLPQEHVQLSTTLVVRSSCVSPASSLAGGPL